MTLCKNDLSLEMRSLLSRFTHVESDPLRAALLYWLSLCDNRVLPQGSAFDPGQLAEYSENCWWVRRVDGGGDFDYLEAGADISTTHRSILKGRSLKQVTDPAAYPRVLRYFDRTLDTPCVTHVTGRLYSERLEPARGERLMLPLMEDNGPRQIFGITVHNLAMDGEFRNSPNRQILTHTPIFSGPSSVTIRAL